MPAPQATAEVFWTAFMAMSQDERRAFLERLIADPTLREDLLDAALIEERKQEPTRPVEGVLVEPTKHRGGMSRAA